MTDTLTPPDAAITGPQERVDAWLADFEAALAARDVEAAAGMFATDSFWRDLVAFTWNLKTVEGREGVADMLRARLHDADPSGFRTTEPPPRTAASSAPGSRSRRRSAAASGTCG